jgi:hypothetical protein
VPTPRGTRLPPVGSSFAAHVMSGWDELAPTIEPCRYPGPGAFCGRALPDHGELRSLAWEVLEASAREATLRVSASVLPLELVRRAVLRPHHLRLDYHLSVRGSEPVHAFWNAHPLFAGRSGTRLVLPASVARVLDVIDARKRVAVDWPAGLDVASRLPPGTGRKLYVEPEQTITWAALEDPDGTTLTMSWEAGRPPYTGLWLDNGWYSRGPVVAIEPALAFCDELALAVETGRAPLLAPQQVLSWSIGITLGASAGPG